MAANMGANLSANLAAMSRPAAYAVSAALLLASAGVAAPGGSARADDACASAPGAAAPAGQHWYYRFDRVKNRKCWFMRALGSLSAHAAAEFHNAPALAAPPQGPSAPAPAEAAMGPSLAPGTPPAAHVTMLAVKPDPQFTGTIAPAESSSLAAASGAAAEPQTPQVASRSADVPVRGDSLRGSPANSVTASGASAAAPQAQGPATPAAATIPSATKPSATKPSATKAPAAMPSANSAATAAAPAQSAESFPVWALGFVIAAALVVLFAKMTGLLRMAWLSRHPDDAWQKGFYERDNPFVAPLESLRPTDLNLLRRIERSPPVQAGHPVSRPALENRDSRNRVKPAPQDIEVARAPGGSRAGATATLDRG